MQQDYRNPALVLIILTIGFLCASGNASAQTQIHKCTDADGEISYSQLPCPPVAPKEPEEPEPEEPVEADAREPTEDQAACKKQIRDQIDAIDAEIGREYSPEKAEDYKKRLLVLTRELRKC